MIPICNWVVSTQLKKYHGQKISFESYPRAKVPKNDRLKPSPIDSVGKVVLTTRVLHMFLHMETKEHSQRKRLPPKILLTLTTTNYKVGPLLVISRVIML